MTTPVEVTVSYLEMAAPEALRPATRVPDGVTLRRVPEDALAATARRMYLGVGAGWHWRDRLAWADGDWRDDLAGREAELWLAEEAGGELGYLLLVRAGDAREILYFGLLPTAIGRGVGGWMLTEAVRRAWAASPARVILNTCTLDAPTALPNYLARGFVVVRREHQQRILPP